MNPVAPFHSSEPRLEQDLPSPMSSEIGAYPLRRFDSASLQEISNTTESQGTSILDQKVELPRAASENDELEVRFGGKEDRENPGNFPTTKKWIIMVIISFNSRMQKPTGEYLLIRKCMRFRNIHRNIPAYHKRITLLRTDGHSRAFNFYSRNANCAAVPVTIIRGCHHPPLSVLLTDLSKFYGRRPIYPHSLSLSLLWLLTCALASNAQTLIIARFLGGLSGAAFLSVAGANAGDLFSPSELQLPMTIHYGIQFMGPETGPIVCALSTIMWVGSKPSIL